MPSDSDLDAVTIDAFGTLVELVDPVPPLARALEARGVEREPEAVRRAFEAEAEYYVAHSHEGRDDASLAALRADCAEIFLRNLDARLDVREFVRPFVDALQFRLVDGARTALDRLGEAGLALACVTNWDYTFPEHLDRLGVADRFATVVTSAEAGAQKPDPAIFHLALERLGVAPDRALHVGDSETDREGAEAAGLAFVPVPLATLPARLGLDASLGMR